jgi:hypothetical protein
VALEYAGKTIYHAYKGDDIEARMAYWFNSDPDERDEFKFDVRELDAWHAMASRRWCFGMLTGDLQQVMRCAVDDGEIVFPDGSVTLYVLDDGETYGGGAFKVDVSPEQYERIAAGEKVCDVAPDWDRYPLTQEGDND